MNRRDFFKGTAWVGMAAIVVAHLNESDIGFATRRLIAARVKTKGYYTRNGKNA